MDVEQTIEVPDDLKSILKEYSKSAIREQPVDLLQWSLQYFQSLKEKKGSEEYHKVAPEEEIIEDLKNLSRQNISNYLGAETKEPESKHNLDTEMEE